MLNSVLPGRLSEVTLTSFVLISGIMIGIFLGYFSPSTGEWLGNGVDYALLLLVGLLFFGVLLDALLQLGKSGLRFIVIAVFANFVLLPFIGYGIASLFLSSHPLLIVGLVIYFMSPCTDWFLSFTRLSRGNVALGTALIPVNMTLQLLLYQIYLQIFAEQSVAIEVATIGSTLLQWFLVPLVVAIIARQVLRLLLKPEWFESVLEKADQTTLWLTSLLVLQIFAANILVITEHLAVFVWVLSAVFTFFLVTWLLGKGLSRVFRLGYPEHALLTMTIASRNAPMMLAITIAALHDQPLIYSALIIGMLIEIPYLTALRRFLLKSRQYFSVERDSTSATTQT